jgi:hypothetical protein
MTGTTTPDSSRIAEDVIGAWRLVSYVVEDADGGNRTYPLGEDAHGVSSTPRPVTCPCRSAPPGVRNTRTAPCTAALTPSVPRPLRATWLTPADTPCPDAGVIDHLPDVSLFPNWEHTAVPRRATIANNRLTLELVEPLVIDGRPRAGRLTWERVEVFEARTKPLGATGSSELHTAATEGER